MEQYDIQPVHASALPDVASFLWRWKTNRDEESSIARAVWKDALTIESRLRWLLLENPLATGVSQYGFCIRDSSRHIRGLLLAFPAAFLIGEQRLLGLCSGSFFVESEFRTLGYYLFKRYLTSPGYNFFFATTCNEKSGPVWRAVGACGVPNSETEYILPLNIDVALAALLTKRISTPAAVRIARAIGSSVNPVVQLLAPRSKELTVEPCRDWDKLSALFLRHRSADQATTDRSAVFLQWRYAQNSPNYPTDIFLFRDKRGNEGWFSLGNIARGRHGQVRGRVLLDAIWPQNKMSFKKIFRTILRFTTDETDAIFFRPRRGINYRKCSARIIRRRLPGPQIFVFNPKGSTAPAVSSMDFVSADGDSGF